MRSRLAPALAICAAVLGILVATSVLVMIAQHGRILPGTVVAGVDVGGQDVASARRILAPALAAETRHPVAVATPGARIMLDPRVVGLDIDVDRTVSAAFARGRAWHASSLIARLLAPVRSVPVSPHRTVDVVALAGWVDEVADRIDRDGSVGTLDISSTDTDFAVVTIGPQGAVTVDRASSVEVLHAALQAGDRAVRLVAAAELPPAGRTAIEILAGDVEHALQRPMLLSHDGRTLTITPDVLARLVDIGSGADPAGRPTPTLEIPDARVRALLGPEGRSTFDRPALDARIVTEREPPVAQTALGTTTFVPVEIGVTIEPGNSSVTFVTTRTAAQIAQLIAARKHVAVADVEEVDPAVTTAAALAGRPTHLLGTFTTFYAAGAPRTVNIALLTDILDDHLIEPGATFSINETSGPRRCEDGFVPAGTIIRGELVDTCGGGVSQIGTTMMNAAFFAGVPLEQWQPHSFFISRYPAGREATLSYPELDVRFTNDTDAYLVLRASTTPTSVTFSLYGVPRWQEVGAVHGERRAPTDFGLEERSTTALPPGARRVVQEGGGGFTITVERIRTPIATPAPDDPAAEIVRERWTTVYRPQQRIVEVGALLP